jgi:hypothetical protein
MAAKDRDLSKVHAVDDGHVILLWSQSDSIDPDEARLALTAVLRSEVRR